MKVTNMNRSKVEPYASIVDAALEQLQKMHQQDNIMKKGWGNWYPISYLSRLKMKFLKKSSLHKFG